MSASKYEAYEEEEVVEVVEEDGEDDEDGRDQDKPATKKQKKSLMQMNESSEMYGDLGRGKRVTVRAFQGRVGVDIREYYDKGGKMLPGKKGIWLTKDNFKSLLQYLPEIEEMVMSAPQ
mmetsp:Transcript_30185/g.115774  ORF Transcript_30185/g.115774 Transcript_30185/m.115774 type:complete len:119 (-) Transcript_30185:155-511(-)